MTGFNVKIFLYFAPRFFNLVANTGRDARVV